MDRPAIHSGTSGAPGAGTTVMISILIICGLLAWALAIRPDAREQTHPAMLKVYCAASLVAPVEQIAEQFNRQYGSRVEIVRSGGSGELAGQIRAEAEMDIDCGADLFISADSEYLDQAVQNGILLHPVSIASQQPVLAMPADSQLEWVDLADLCHRPGIRYGIAHPQAAIGKMTRQLARRSHCQAELVRGARTEAENVMVLGQALATHSLDAAIVWDTTVEQINRQAGRQVIRIATRLPIPNDLQNPIAVGVVARSNQLGLAERFQTVLTSVDFAAPILRSHGFRPINDSRSLDD